MPKLQDSWISILIHTTPSRTHNAQTIFVKLGRSTLVLGFCWITVHLHLLFFLCVSAFVSNSFSLSAVQEQYLVLHLTLIFLSSYSQLWVSFLSASGCAPRACRNPDKGDISEMQDPGNSCSLHSSGTLEQGLQSSGEERGGCRSYI